MRGPGGLEVALEAPGVDRARAKSRLPRGGRLQKKNADCYGDGGLRKTSMVHAAAAAAAAARLDSTRLDIRIKRRKHDCNGEAEPKEPQYKENETLERKSLS